MFKTKTRNLNIVFAVVILLVVSSSWIIPIIKSDTQVWENSYGKLEVYPIIASNSFWSFKQYFNATSYLPSQNIDIVFRFNDTIKGRLVVNNNSVSFEHISFNGYEWYIKRNVFFEQYDTISGYWEYSTNSASGKWDLFLKRSSDSLSYALDNNLYVHLDPWWNSSYLYRNCSRICNNVTDYAVNLNISYNAHMQNDFDDIRFVGTPDDNVSFYELYWWIEDKSDGNWCNLWVNISNASWICMYYGCDGCSMTSYMSGDDTFLFFDDFTGTTMDASKWDEVLDNTIDWSNDGIVTLDGNSWLRTDDTFGTYNIRARSKAKLTSYDGVFLGLTEKSDTTETDLMQVKNSDSDQEPDSMETITIQSYEDGGASERTTNIPCDDQTNYNTYDIKWFSDNIKFYQNDDLLGTHTSKIPDDVCYMFFRVWGNPSTLTVDWCFISLCATTEPTLCNWFGEEEKPISCWCVISDENITNGTINVDNFDYYNFSVNVSSHCGCIQFVNITVANVSYNWTAGIYPCLFNGTYYFNVTDYGQFNCSQLGQPNNISWSVTVGCGNETGYVVNSTSFWFIMEYCTIGGGCDCDDIWQMFLNYDAFKESDNMNLIIDNSQLSIFLTLVLFAMFFYIGFSSPKKVGGSFVMFSGFIFIGLSLLISSYLNAVYIAPLMLPFAGFIILVGVYKWFWGEGKKTED